MENLWERAMRETTLPSFHRFTCGDLETFWRFLVLCGVFSCFLLLFGFGVVVLLSTFSRSF